MTTRTTTGPYWNAREDFSYTPTGGSLVTVATAYRTSKYSKKETVSNNLPDYWKLLSRGSLLPHTSYEQFVHWMGGGRDAPIYDGRFEFSDTGPNPDRYYSYPRGWGANLGTVSGGNAFNDNPFGLTTALLDSIVTSRANGAFSYLPQQAAANLAQNGFDATTFMAEIFSTRRLFLRTFDSAKYALENLQRFKRRIKRMSKLDWINTVNDAWLTGRYGFRPLYYDVKDLSELAAKTFGDKQDSKYQFGRAGSSVSGQHITDSTTSSSFFTTSINYRDVISYDISFRGSVSSKLLGGLSNVDNNLLSTAWELVPFSFVVDWFVNVGNAIAVQEFLLRSQMWYASYGYSITGKVRRYTNGLPTPRSGVTLYHMVPPSNELSFERVVRVPTTVSNLPITRVRMSSAKTADAAALLYAIYTRSTRR